MKILVLLYVFLFGVTVSGFSLSGKWKNELESTVVFSSSKNGLLTGWYTSAVGNVNHTQVFPLLGYWDYTSQSSAILGFTVSWNGTSLTTWAGQAYENILYTQWLLVSPTKLDYQWTSTRIGTNVFKKL